MPAIPDIRREDISIAPVHSGGFEHTLCERGLWSIHNVIKRMAADAQSDPDGSARRAIECLYMIGANARFADSDMGSLIYTGRTNPKYRRAMPAAKYLFALEQYGFVFSDLATTKPDAPKSTLAVKDIVQFVLSYGGADFPDVMFGLKLFAGACVNVAGDPFNVGDIRILFEGASKLYAPPVGEVFFSLTEGQRSTMERIHEKLDGLGCSRNLEREYMMKYFHPKAKGKAFATLYLSDVLGYWGKDEDTSISVKLNLRHIGKYVPILSQCTDSIRRSVAGAEDCGGCKKACGGVSFELEGVHYRKCPWHIFRFNDFSERAMANYESLIDLESSALYHDKH